VEIRKIPGAESPTAWRVEKPAGNKDFCQAKRCPWGKSVLLKNKIGWRRATMKNRTEKTVGISANWILWHTCKITHIYLLKHIFLVRQNKIGTSL